ncbi:MAG: T9SS type A sorting domain-containing protein, partial [Chitinophagaceae bacterium]|nr:T9SS type A sorting domain-containing protein [Chitinophagaceae bacterium]
NLSAEPGCVQVSVVSAGTTWVPLGAGNRSAKVFQIEPSANGSATSYSLSLYFTADELNGRSPSNLKIAKTSAANLSEVNASNTIIVTPTVTMLGTNAVFTGDFTGFSKFFLVDESFVLPVTLVSFTGKLNERAEAVLDWEVSRQYDFRGFDVERSNDGTHFSAIQNIPATQGYGSIVSYTYADKNITEGANYYRLRMIDNDGHFTYSPVVRINYQGSGRFVSLAGNPVADAITVLLNNRDLRPVSATLFNVIGARIGSWHLGSRTGTVSLPIDQFKLTPGIYLLQISDGARVTTLKVQKK